jgi:hypothetical protein
LLELHRQSSPIPFRKSRSPGACGSRRDDCEAVLFSRSICRKNSAPLYAVQVAGFLPAHNSHPRRQLASKWAFPEAGCRIHFRRVRKGANCIKLRGVASFCEMEKRRPLRRQPNDHNFGSLIMLGDCRRVSAGNGVATTVFSSFCRSRPFIERHHR